MLQTYLGRTVEKWSDSAKADMKVDLEKLTTAPAELLRKTIDVVARNSPCINALELAAYEAEQHELHDPQELIDAVTVFNYIWINTEKDKPQAVVNDLRELNLLSQGPAVVLTELLEASQPFRKTAEVKSNYLRIGAPLFADIRGTVDIRCRFHRTSDEFDSARHPTELVDTHPVILANLSLGNPNGNTDVVMFLMDENDLAFMKRFVRNMERELELATKLIGSSSGLKSNV